MFGVRRRFVLVALAVTALVTLAFALPLAALAHRVVQGRVLVRAEREADAVAAVLRVTADQPDIVRALDGLAAGRRERVTVRLPDGTVVRATGAPPGITAAVDPTRVAGSGRREPIPVDGGVVHQRAATTPEGRPATIEVFIPSAELRTGVRTAWLALAGLALVLLAAAAWIADRMAREVVTASRALAGAAARLGAGDIEVRVTPAGPPEIATAGAAFNEMAGRITMLLAAERELVADLSHRLRTPLTVLRLNAEALPAGTERDRLLDAAAHVRDEVDAIIERARQPLTPTAPGRCDLARVVADRSGFWSVLAEDQGRRWSTSGLSAPADIAVAYDDTAAALDAIIGNVFQHTAPGTAYQVSVARQPGAVLLTVDDAGPGIGLPQRSVQRGVSGTESTGLGLDIARQVAAATGGSLSVEASPLGGARVQLTFAA
jgi:signal transduction histidine kinase